MYAFLIGLFRMHLDAITKLLAIKIYSSITARLQPTRKELSVERFSMSSLRKQEEILTAPVLFQPCPHHIYSTHHHELRSLHWWRNYPHPAHKKRVQFLEERMWTVHEHHKQSGRTNGILERVQIDVQSPNSIFSRSTDDLQGWKVVSAGCSAIVTELEEIIDKYKSLGTNKKRNWDKIRLACKRLNDIKRELVKETTSISAYLSVLGLSSQGRVENELLPELLRKIDHVAARMRKGNSTIHSTITMTTVDGDDKSLWRDFRRDLLRDGIRGRDVKRHSIALQTYLGQLQRRGMLDEDVPGPFLTW